MRNLQSVSFFTCFLAICQCYSVYSEPVYTNTSVNKFADKKVASFHQFTYTGNDPVFEPPLKVDEYQNPVIAGFYPDPSVVRVNKDYYLVNSTFGYFPGIPIFHSNDLVNWQQIGNVIDRHDMLDFDGLGLSWGVFAATIDYRDGLFYVVNTCVFCGGNYVVTANDPKGPWSDPIWLADVGGIDPSLFFDNDGRAYLIHNDTSESGREYIGHNFLIIREIDPITFETLGEPVKILDKGVRPEENPVWLEGPHLYKIYGKYYLTAAEGGTREGHNQVILRSDHVFGPYIPYEGNPILTQKGLSQDRPHPVTSTGHADFVQDIEGNWWALFLGVRPYSEGLHNTGRETFLLPVSWDSGWPVILSESQTVPYRGKYPPGQNLHVEMPITGNFRVHEEFDEPLGMHWVFVRVPQEKWWHVENGALRIAARNERLGAQVQPSVVLRRQQHINAVAETTLSFKPENESDEAGLLVIQNDNFYYALGFGVNQSGETVVRLRRRAGEGKPARGEVVAERVVSIEKNDRVNLKISSTGKFYSFAYSVGKEAYSTLVARIDGSILSTSKAGGFVGAMFGMYAETN